MYRQPVVDWMIDVCGYFKLHITTAHAAISYLDRLQPDENCERHEWQMIAVACILVAAKYNESELDVPQLQVFEDIIHQKITNDTMLTYELWVLRRLCWQLNARTTAAFLSTYFASGTLIDYDSDSLMQSLEEKCQRKGVETLFYNEAMRLCNLCLTDPQFKPFLASDVAGAIVYRLRSLFDVAPVWSPALTKLTKFDPLRCVSHAKCASASSTSSSSVSPNCTDAVQLLLSKLFDMAVDPALVTLMAQVTAESASALPGSSKSSKTTSSPSSSSSPSSAPVSVVIGASSVSASPELSRVSDATDHDDSVCSGQDEDDQGACFKVLPSSTLDLSTSSSSGDGCDLDRSSNCSQDSSCISSKATTRPGTPSVNLVTSFDNATMMDISSPIPPVSGVAAGSSVVATSVTATSTSGSAPAATLSSSKGRSNFSRMYAMHSQQLGKANDALRKTGDSEADKENDACIATPFTAALDSPGDNDLAFTEAPSLFKPLMTF